MKITINNNMTYFGYFMVGTMVFMLIGSIIGIFTQPEDIIGIVIFIALLIYGIKLFYPLTQFKKKIDVNKEENLIINKVKFKDQSREEEFKMEEIKSYGVINVIKGKEILAKDPSAMVMYSSKNAITTYFGYIEFEEDRYLIIYSGRRGAVKKKMEKIQKYIELGE